MEISALIKKSRNEASLTQEQAAEALGVSRQTVSNWENGKSYPDIISVIKMSDLYSVSLDYLLKEETSMKQTYKEYLKESTDTVSSNEKRSKLLLFLSTLGIWAVSTLVFWLFESGKNTSGYNIVIALGILPVTFLLVSIIIGICDYLGKLKWIIPFTFGIMYTLVGYASEITTGVTVQKIIIWPDFRKLPIGIIISLAGLIIGILIRKKQKFK